MLRFRKGNGINIIVIDHTDNFHQIDLYQVRSATESLFFAGIRLALNLT